MIKGTKLDTAFKAMRKAGYLCRANFSCCSGCAGAKVANDLEAKVEAQKAKGQSPTLPLGLVFYHQQDNDAVKDWFDGGGHRRWSRTRSCDPQSDLTLYLRFGQIGSQKLGDVGKETVQVGHDLMEALRMAGIDPKWNGDPNTCIQVRVADAFTAVAS